MWQKLKGANLQNGMKSQDIATLPSPIPPFFRAQVLTSIDVGDAVVHALELLHSLAQRIRPEFAPVDHALIIHLNPTMFPTEQ